MRLVYVQVIISTSLGLAAGWGLPRPWRTYLPEKQHVLGSQVDDEEQRSSPPSFLFGNSKTHDQPSVGFVALGDSYSAGIGTGFEGKEDECRLGLGAYPQLIASDLAAKHGGPNNTNNTSFQFLSCTGSTTDDLLVGGAASQIDDLNASRPVDFALLTVGGNDLGFFEVMNACIFRFYNFYSGTCETALAHAQARLDSPDFDQRLFVVITELLDKVRWEKKRPGFRITVTGYARFFDAETEACDDMSLGVWWRGPKLERWLRRRVNHMVLAVNRKIERAVARINGQFTRAKVLFVDYDAAFAGHRFCEAGVAEPDYARNETWFFLVGGPDNVDRNGTGNGTTYFPSSSSSSSTIRTGSLLLAAGKEDDVAAVASRLIDPATCLPPAQRSGDWGELALCYMAMSKAEDPTLRLARDDGQFGTQNSMSHVPTYYGKTFHPRSLGHEAIRDRIYEVWSQQLPT
ncbi:Lipase 1 [Apiospora arundinis]|uniref:Lipase 1 n=1 Tax=Apiospora arundinis TaxID=335852 RepID=A0ABR2HYZ8_9PEZI